MKRFPFAIMAAVLVFSLSACGGGNTAQPPANKPSTETPSTPSTETPSTTAPSGSYDTATAEALFKNTCAGCHGQTLEGAVGPNLQKIGGQLNKDQILEVLNKGKGATPPGLVKGADAETLAAWLADKK